MSRPLGFKPSPPGRIDALNFCIQAYHWPARTCISSGDGRDLGSVEWRKMNRYFGTSRFSKRIHRRRRRPFPRLVRVQRTSGGRSDTVAEVFCKCAPDPERRPGPRPLSHSFNNLRRPLFTKTGGMPELPLVLVTEESSPTPLAWLREHARVVEAPAGSPE